MSWEENLPEWNEEGAEPPQSKKDEGWQAEEKPPAGWFNWLLNRVYKVLQELQGNAEHTSNKGEPDGYASLDGDGNVPEDELGNVDGMEEHGNEYHEPNFATQEDFSSHLSETVPHFKYDYKEELTYNSDGNLVKVELKINNILRREEELTYVEGNLTEVLLKQYADDGVTIEYAHTETLSYDVDDNLEQAERSVV